MEYFSITPAPNAYHVENAKIIEKSAPAYSMKSRFEPKDKKVNPSPNQYNPNATSTVKKAPTFSLSGRHERKDKKVNPAPNAYKPETKVVDTTAPCYTFH